MVTEMWPPSCPQVVHHAMNEWKVKLNVLFPTVFILSTKTKAVLSNLHMPVSLSCFSSGLVFYLPRNFWSFHTIDCMSFIHSFAKRMFTSTSPALYFCLVFSCKLWASSPWFLIFPSSGEDRHQRDKEVHACVLSHFSRVWLFCDPMGCSPSGSSVH